MGEVVNVLHVDDDPGFVEVTADILERERDHFSVTTATSATDGLQVIRDCLPDCVVSDFEMPGMDGLEFLRSVREEYSKLPFILFTGRGSEEVASEAISTGATDYLQKQTGTGHYDLLVNRISNAVSKYHSEQQLEATREEYAAVFENARNGLILVDIEEETFRFRRCNPRALELTGLERSDLVGKTPREALDSEGHKAVTGAYRKCVDQRESISYTVKLNHPVGSVVHEVKTTPVMTDGNVEQLVVAFTDITERHTRQRQLEDERAFIQQALDLLDDPFYVIDTDRSLRRWNQRVTDVTGYAASELSGMAIEELFPADERERIIDAVEATLRDGRQAIEIDILTSDDRRIPCEFVGRRLTDSEGNTTGLVGTGRQLGGH